MKIPRRVLLWAGGLLCAAGCVFVVFRLRQYRDQIDLSHFGPRTWLALTVLALCYGAANLLLAQAWWRLLTFLDPNADRLTTLPWAIRTYGASQLAKYVPGNIAQFASRQVLAVDAGIKGSAAGMSAVWEMAMLSVVAVLFAVLAAPLSPALALVVFGVVLALATIAAFRRWGRPMTYALLEYVAFLAVAGAVFTGALALTAQRVDLTLLPIVCGSYALAWLAGLLTPGAPAGAGVREAALMFLLGARVAPAELVVAAVLGRLAMVIGDVAFFAASSLFRFRP